MQRLSLHLKTLAEWTGLEPATPGVTGRYSNQLNYHSTWCSFRPGGPSAAALLPCNLRCVGDPTGIRTPVIAVKGRCPRPLDDGDKQTGSLEKLPGLVKLDSRDNMRE